jgi:5-methylcytosine-specific restriction endonuclease McrA
MRRRARKLNAFVEDVDPTVLFERDEGLCGICGKPVDLTIAHVDHAIPLARGGEHSYANTQLAHPHCNLSKGARC